MSTSGQGYEIDVEGTRRVLSELANLASKVQSSIADLGGLAVPTGCYGGVGTAVATANVNVHQQSVATLQTVLAVIQQIQQRATQSVNNYAQADTGIAQVLLQLAASDRPTLAHELTHIVQQRSGTPKP
jgi:predicted amino acid dehydrogenase